MLIEYQSKCQSRVLTNTWLPMHFVHMIWSLYKSWKPAFNSGATLLLETSHKQTLSHDLNHTLTCAFNFPLSTDISSSGSCVLKASVVASVDWYTQLIYSVDTWLTSQSTISWESTNFYRHAIECRYISMVNTWPTIDQQLIKHRLTSTMCWSSFDQISTEILIECRSRCRLT